MLITKDEVVAARRSLFAAPPRDRRPADQIDFKVRPISEAWIYCNRVPSYKSAVANAAYIWRDSSPRDRFGPMPGRFAERRCELHGGGLIVPASAPNWALAPYKVWEEADAVAVATNDPTAVAAWHVMMEIPKHIAPRWWNWLVTGFVQQHLAEKGAVTAWAVHGLEGADGAWIVNGHAHLIVTARYWRHDARHGQRHPAWIGSWTAQKRLEYAWKRRCQAARLIQFARFGDEDLLSIRWST